MTHQQQQRLVNAGPSDSAGVGFRVRESVGIGGGPVVHPHVFVLRCFALLGYQNDAMAPRYGGGGEEGGFPRGPLAH